MASDGKYEASVKLAEAAVGLPLLQMTLPRILLTYDIHTYVHIVPRLPLFLEVVISL